MHCHARALQTGSPELTRWGRGRGQGAGIAACSLCGQGGPKPWGQPGEMTLLAESDGGWPPTQRERKFYGRKLDLKSNQVPGQRASPRPQPSGQAVAGEASWGQGCRGETVPAPPTPSPLPRPPLPGEPDPAVSLLVGRIKTPGPKRQEGLKETFVQDEYQGEGSRRGNPAGRPSGEWGARVRGELLHHHTLCGGYGWGARGRLCSHLTGR